MSGPHLLEVRVPGHEPRRIEITRAVVVGRDGDGLIVPDGQVSRRHLRISPDAGGLTLTDLGSTNGTTVNGRPVEGEITLRPGDTVRLGRVEIAVLPSPATAPAVAPGPGPRPVSPVPPPAPRPALDDLASRVTDAAVIRYRPGSKGEAAVPPMVNAAKRARRRLAGLGSEPWGAIPQICLVDPFPDPERPGEIVTEGTIVDPPRGEIWMVVTAESPPEPPERSLALLFGAALPGARDLDLLLEGYGLELSGAPDPDPHLREQELPPLATVGGELRAAMALSFVRHLLERGGREDFRRLLAEAQPGRIDAAARQVYGAGMAALEEAWRRKLAAPPEKVNAGQFLRLAARYLKPHVARQAEMFVYMLAGLAFTMVFPFVFRQLVDSAIPSGRLSEVLGLLAVLGGAFLVSLLAGLRRAYLSAYVSGSVVRQVRVEMFSKLQSLSTGWFARRQQGDVLSRLFSDVGVLEAGLSSILRDGVFQVVSLLVSAVVLVTLNPLLAAVVLVGAPLVAAVYRLMGKGAQRRSMAVQEQVGSVLGVASENYGAQAVIKAFGLEGHERARFRQATDRLFVRQVRLNLFGGLFGLSVNMIVTGLRLAVLGLGAWLILEDRLTVGGLVAFVSIMGEVIAPVTALTGIGQQVQASTGALVRINEVLGAVPEVADAPDATPLAPLQHEIRLAGVSFSYSPERRVLNGLDVVIPAGSRVAFVGPTGAGKSSVLQLLMRFHDPEEGAVLFDGTDLRRVTAASLRSQLGVVFQETFLFDGSIRENIALGRPGATDADIEAAARAAELHDFVVSLPRGYDTPVGERGGRLSGGQRQRLALARAMVRDPRVLVLDEATSALDPRTERLISETLERLSRGRTTVAVTHRLTSITSYDRIFVIADGRLVEEGAHDDLVRRGGVYASMWADQTGGGQAVEATFDVAGALQRVPLFAGLDRAVLHAVADRLRTSEVRAGDTLSEGGGGLVLVRRGRGRVLVPGLGGSLAPVAEIGPGDAFGVAAVLGQPSGAVLEAIEVMSVLVLDEHVIAGLAANFEAVSAALAGKQRASAVPAGGKRLSRLTRGPSSPAPGGEAPPAVALDGILRQTGSLPAVPVVSG